MAPARIEENMGVPVSPKHAPRENELFHSPDFDSYEQLRVDLSRAMKSYVHAMQEEGLPLPSLSPGHVVGVDSQSAAILNQKTKVIAFAKRILAMTMDPSMTLFLESLQVSVLHEDGPQMAAQKLSIVVFRSLIALRSSFTFAHA